MALFPSPLERTVASALLLLSTTSPSPSPLNGETSKDRKSSETSLSVASIEWKSSSSYLTSDVSSKEVWPNKLNFVAVAAGRHQLKKLKVVKKSRSKLCWSSDNQKVRILKSEANRSGSMSTEVSSLSSSSSAISSAESKHSTGAEKETTANLEKLRKKRGGLNHMHHRAKGILKLFSGDGFPEGDSTDTSKALRVYSQSLSPGSRPPTCHMMWQFQWYTSRNGLIIPTVGIIKI